VTGQLIILQNDVALPYVLIASGLQLWKFRPQVQQLIDKSLSRIRSLPSPTVGFHIRGGDKFKEDQHLVRALTPVSSFMMGACQEGIVQGSGPRRGLRAAS
jgi:hypothetical protein